LTKKLIQRKDQKIKRKYIDFD